MRFVNVAKTDDIPIGRMKSFVIGEKEILIANYEGKYYAIGCICTHKGENLARGRLQGKVVTCPIHGDQFDVTTGACITGPSEGSMTTKGEDERSYAVKVEGNIIKVNL